MSRGVLVTGATRGIGAAVARAFADLGDRVAVLGTSSAEQVELVRAALPGGPHVGARADLTDPEAVRRAVDGVALALGRLDVVVNNAGTFVDHSVTQVDYAGWQAAWARTLGVNLIGAANVSYCAAQHMVDAGGVMVNVSSRGAFRGEPTAPAYAASKAGLNALGQSLALALAPHGISVATVAPGFVDTEMAAGLLSGPQGDQIRGQSPFGRVATAEEVAAAVVYLASPQAQWASGAVLDLNGASHLRS